MFENVQYDLTRIAYGRRGCFLYLSLSEENDMQTLWVCALLSQMDTAGAGQTPRVGKLFPVQLLRDGKPLTYKAIATPLCVTLTYEGGSARLCLQQGDILRMEACNAQIALSPDLAPHEIA